VIQELVQTRTSGVLFTRDPASGDAVCVIAGAFGLGEGVVAGRAESDTYRIGHADDAVRAEVSYKRRRVVAAPGGGVREEALARGGGEARVIDDVSVRRLRDLGLGLERLIGCPQDVEWGFDDHGALVLLQSRPITHRPAAGSHGQCLWDNANIVESYPGLTRPLTFSFVRIAYERAFGRLMRDFLPFGPAPDPRLPARLLGYMGGRIYYNLRTWYALLAWLPGARRQREAWDRLIGVREGDDAPLATPPWRSRLLVLLCATRAVLGLRRVEREFARRFADFEARHVPAVEGAHTPEALVAEWQALSAEAGSFWHLTLLADFQALKHHQWCAALWRRFTGEPALPAALLCGERPLASVAPVRSLAALAERAVADPAWRRAVEAGEDEDVLRRLEMDPGLAALRAAFEAHLAAFGERSPEELKLETATFREDPRPLVALLRRFVREGVTTAALAEREDRARRAGAEALARLRGPLRRTPVGWLAGRARRALGARETMRLARGRLFGLVRQLFLKLGSAFVAEGVIDEARDVFDLTVEELIGRVEGTAVTHDLRSLVALRRAEAARWAVCTLPPRFATEGLPHPERVAREAVAATAPEAGDRVLHGTGGAPGRASGRARVLREPGAEGVAAGDVLVAPSTDPGWIFLMLSSRGLVVEQGSLLSHAAVVGRELGIPTVVGVAGATRRIPQGALLTLDGTSGEVSWS
jgi:rifampicin phosphotransferase